MKSSGLSRRWLERSPRLDISLYSGGQIRTNPSWKYEKEGSFPPEDEKRDPGIGGCGLHSLKIVTLGRTAVNAEAREKLLEWGTAKHTRIDMQSKTGILDGP